MANTLYDNFVLENKFTNILNTKLGVRPLMTIDTSLTDNAGVIKKINTYTYAGEVEKLAKGQKNTRRGSVTVETKQYEVKLAQQVFDYHDEEVMQDPLVVEVGMNGMAQVMTNDFNKEYFEEVAKATLEQTYTTLNYDTIVDAIAKMNLESEEGLYLVISPSSKAEVRKDPDFKASKLGEILYNGQIGDISGVPVIVSKLAVTPVLATPEAVTCYVKKESEIEQVRDGEARKNTLITRKVNLIALTDATKVVKFKKQAA